MISAVLDPIINGRRLPNCDVFIFEEARDRPSRCHDGLLQLWEEETHGMDNIWQVALPGREYRRHDQRT